MPYATASAGSSTLCEECFARLEAQKISETESKAGKDLKESVPRGRPRAQGVLICLRLRVVFASSLQLQTRCPLLMFSVDSLMGGLEHDLDWLEETRQSAHRIPTPSKARVSWEPLAKDASATASLDWFPTEEDRRLRD